MPEVTQSPRVSVGRPRDPGVNLRAMNSAVELFGEMGWSSVSMDAVARRSGVSKRSMYLRWPNKEALLVEALTKCLSVVSDIDTGSVESDLAELARQLVDLYAGPTGTAALRLAFEPGDFHAVRILEELRRSQLRAARALVRRAISTGQLPPATSATLLLDTVCGAALMHVITTPISRRAVIRARASSYAADLVDFVMRGLDGAQDPM
jgi:AcrR family transcriptional regulator